MAYNFKAGTLSTNGLVVTLGVTAEKELGLIQINNANDWINRLNKNSYTTGPTGAWKNEWLSVYRYLTYTDTGTCFIGGTGSTGSYTSYSLTNTPLHNTALVDMDVVFDAGNTFSAGAAKNIALARQDCVALIGNKSDLTSITSSYVASGGITNDFGITANSSEFACFVAGRRQLDLKTIYAAWRSEYIITNFSADVAGVMAKNSYLTDVSTVVAGIGSTKTINNVINLTQQLSDTDALNLNNNNINPVRQFAGLGTYLMGNKTFKNDSTSALNSLSVTLTINYIKRNLRTILSEYLFAPNNATTRNAITSRVNSFLNNLYIFSPAGGSSYSVICDSTNNTTSSTNLVVDVQLTLATAISTITLNIVNSEDLTTITSYTVR